MPDGPYCWTCGCSSLWCDCDRDASLAEDAERLSGEAVAARAEGIAQGIEDTPETTPTPPEIAA